MKRRRRLFSVFWDQNLSLLDRGPVLEREKIPQSEPANIICCHNYCQAANIIWCHNYCQAVNITEEIAVTIITIVKLQIFFVITTITIVRLLISICCHNYHDCQAANIIEGVFFVTVITIVRVQILLNQFVVTIITIGGWVLWMKINSSKTYFPNPF